MKQAWRTVIIWAGISTAAVLLLFLLIFINNEQFKVAAGTAIQTGDVYYESLGNTDVKIALKRTQLMIENYLEGSMTFNSPSKKVTAKLRDVGLSIDESGINKAVNGSVYGPDIIKSLSKHLKYENTIDIAHYFIINNSMIDDFIENSFKFIEKKPENAVLFINNQGKAEIRNEIVGISLDKQKFRESVISSIESCKHEVDVALVEVKPETCKQDIQKIMPYDLIASYKSDYSGSDEGRKENIRLGAELLNNILIEPGEEFEFWKYVGDTTPSRGFKPAGVYINGRIGTDIGGGLCQVSSTLYNAALLADLSITERSPHSLSVGYVPLGLDATVSIGTHTLKFINNTGNYILIKSNTNGKDIIFDIYGQRAGGKTVKVYSKLISQNSADAYREVYINGILNRQDFLGRSTYNPHK